MSDDDNQRNEELMEEIAEDLKKAVVPVGGIVLSKNLKDRNK